MTHALGGTEMAYDRWLCHHGVKGLKWGVRLYQKKDGSLTPLGRYRYFKRDSKLTKAGKKALTDGNGALSDRGLALIKAHSKDGTGYKEDEKTRNYFKQQKELVIKKGEQFVRYASLDEPLDSKRKYVAYGKDLAYKYQEFASSGMLGIEGSDYATYTYTAKKDLKVAVLSPSDIAKKYIKQDKLTKQKMELAERSSTFTTRQAMKRRDLRFVEKALQRSKDYVDALYSKDLEKFKSDIQKKGYDAVLDWNDANISIIRDGKAEYPLILLDPKKSVKLSKYEKDPWRT